MQFKVGSYVGDGTNPRTISGLGFEPVFVLIVGTSPNAWWRTASMPSGQSARTSNGMTSNRITGFTSDGFTLGVSTFDVNSGFAPNSYWYLAIGAGDEVAEASYAGTYAGGPPPWLGTDIDVGFDPQVLVIADNTQSPVIKTAANAGVAAQLFDAAAADSHGVAFITDGFHVGIPDGMSNSPWDFSSRTYYYFALAESAYFALLDYEGDGQDDRTLVGLGLRPRFALAKRIDAANATLMRVDGMPAGGSYLAPTSAYPYDPLTDGIHDFAPDSIELGDGDAANANGSPYTGFAIGYPPVTLDLDLRWEIRSVRRFDIGFRWSVSAAPSRIARALVTSPVVLRYRFEKVTRAGQFLADVSRAFDMQNGGRIECNNDRAVTRTATFRVFPGAGLIDPLRDHIRVVADLLVDGTVHTDIPMGIYALTFPRKTHTPMAETWEVRASDMSTHLARATTTAPFKIPSGTNYMAALADVLDRVRGAYPGVVKPLSPLLYWRLGETSGSTAADASGNSRNGTYIGSPTLGQRGLLAGDGDRSVRFGSGKYVEHAYSSDFDFTDGFTFAGLLKINQLPGSGQSAIIAARDGVVLLRVNGSDEGSGLAAFVTIDGDGAEPRAVTPFAMEANRTYAFMAAWDGARLELYLDGDLVASQARTGAIASNSNGFYAGADLDGWLDELAVWDRPLGPADARALSAAAFSADRFRYVLPVSSKTAPVDQPWDVGTPWITVANDMLHAVGCYNHWFDNDGILRSRLLDDGATRTPDVVYAAGDGFIVPPADEDVEDTRFANQVVVVVNNPDREPLVAVATNNDPDSPTSTVALGMTITKRLTGDRAADQETLQTLANHELSQSSSFYRRLTLNTLVDPRRAPNEVYEVTLPGASDAERWYCRGWTLDLRTGAAMQHRLSRVQKLAVTE